MRKKPALVLFFLATLGACKQGTIEGGSALHKETHWSSRTNQEGTIGQSFSRHTPGILVGIAAAGAMGLAFYPTEKEEIVSDIKTAPIAIKQAVPNRKLLAKNNAERVNLPAPTIALSIQESLEPRVFEAPPVVELPTDIVLDTGSDFKTKLFVVGGLAILGGGWCLYKHLSSTPPIVRQKVTKLPDIDFGHSGGYDRMFIGNISFRLKASLQHTNVDLIPNYEEAFIAFATSYPELENALFEIIEFASDFLDNHYILDKETQAIVLYYFKKEMEMHAPHDFTDSDEE